MRFWSLVERESSPMRFRGTLAQPTRKSWPHRRANIFPGSMPSSGPPASVIYHDPHISFEQAPKPRPNPPKPPTTQPRDSSRHTNGEQGQAARRWFQTSPKKKKCAPPLPVCIHSLQARLWCALRLGDFAKPTKSERTPNFRGPEGFWRSGMLIEPSVQSHPFLTGPK